MVRIPPDMLSRIDAWILHFDVASRPEAIRQLVGTSVDHILPKDLDSVGFDNLMMISAEENRALVEGIDDWRRNQPDLPSRSEAIRRLVEKALEPSRA